MAPENRTMECKSLQTIAQYVFFYIGLAHTTGVKASIVEGVNVFVAIIVASLIFRQEKLTVKKIVGNTVAGSISARSNERGFSIVNLYRYFYSKLREE